MFFIRLKSSDTSNKDTSQGFKKNQKKVRFTNFLTESFLLIQNNQFALNVLCTFMYTEKSCTTTTVCKSVKRIAISYFNYFSKLSIKLVLGKGVVSFLGAEIWTNKTSNLKPLIQRGHEGFNSTIAQVCINANQQYQ